MYRIELDEAPRGGALTRMALAVSGLVLFYTSIGLYANTAFSTPPPSAWMLLYMAAAGAVAVLQPRSVLALVRTPTFHWFLAFFLITMAWGIFQKGVPSISDTIQTRFASIALFVAFGILIQEERIRRACMVAVAWAVVLAVLLNVMESLALIQFVYDPGRVAGRAGGIYVNANTSAANIVFGLAAAVPAIPSRWRIPLLVAGAAGIALTFSRGAALAYGVLLVVLAVTRVIKVSWGVGALLLAVAAVTWFSGDLRRILEISGVLNENTESRLRMTADDSGRLELAARAWQMFLSSPVFGNGIGSTVDWDMPVQPHNQYLSFAADHGILGLLLLPALALALALGNRAALPFSMVLLVSGLFSHGLLASRPMLILLPLVALPAASLTAGEAGDLPARPGRRERRSAQPVASE